MSDAHRPTVATGRLTAALATLRPQGELGLIASLPVHDLVYARAALRGGAHALKVHFGLTHRASGEVTPPLREQPDVLRRLRDLAPDVPLGAVLGTTAEEVDRDLDLACALGLDFISGYAHALPARIFQAGPEILVAFDDRTPATWATHLPVGTLLEASVVSSSDYGLPLTATDLLRYAELRRLTPALLVIPTQKRVQPQDLPALRQLGADALMYGVVVTGEGAAGFEEAAARYRSGR